MTLAWIHRPPTDQEIEKLRLVLSTYQDGSGQIARGADLTLPGWRDFERSIALVFGGEAQESKAIFDVLIPDPDRTNVYFGLSCKMRSTLTYLRKKGRVTIEVSNSSGKFWDSLARNGLNSQNYHQHPLTAGNILLQEVRSWYKAVALEEGGNVDVTRSCQLALQWDTRSGLYQLFQIDLELPASESLNWSVDGRRLKACDEKGVLLEWYGLSGGQLKYYPFESSALWSSPPFHLERLPEQAIQNALMRKVQEYFPERWRELSAY